MTVVDSRLDKQFEDTCVSYRRVSKNSTQSAEEYRCVPVLAC